MQQKKENFISLTMFKGRYHMDDCPSLDPSCRLDLNPMGGRREER
jgi:hypothetical protein